MGHSAVLALARATLVAALPRTQTPRTFSDVATRYAPLRASPALFDPARVRDEWLSDEFLALDGALTEDRASAAATLEAAAAADLLPYKTLATPPRLPRGVRAEDGRDDDGTPPR